MQFDSKGLTILNIRLHASKHSSFFMHCATDYTLQVSSMLQGSGVTDACDAGCAQHCPFNPACEAVFTSPLCKCGEVNLLPIPYMQAIEFGTDIIIATVLVMQFHTKGLMYYPQHTSPCI